MTTKIYNITTQLTATAVFRVQGEDEQDALQNLKTMIDQDEFEWGDNDNQLTDINLDWEGAEFQYKGHIVWSSLEVK